MHVPKSIQVLCDADVVKLLDAKSIRTSLEEAFHQLGMADARQPPQMQVQLPRNAGDVIYYSGVMAVPPLIGVTVSPFLVSRLNLGLPPVTAYTMILSADSGQLVAIIESRSMIAARTGGTTCLAASRLAKRFDRVAIIGAGQVAEWHLRHLQDAPLSEVMMFSPSILSPEKSERRSHLREIDDRIRFCDSARVAVEGAGVVMLCTASALPVLDVGWTAPDALITSVTTDGVNAHEIDPAALSEMDVYCDFRATTPFIAGEMVLARERFGWMESSVVMDLPELVAGTISLPVESGRRRYFRSIGLGIEDVAASAALLGLGKLGN